MVTQSRVRTVDTPEMGQGADGPGKDQRTRLPGRVRKFAGLSARDKRVFSLACVLLPVVGFSLRVLGYRNTRGWIKSLGVGRQRAEGRHLDAEALQSISRLVESAARQVWGSPACLAKSVVLGVILGRLGVDSELRVGVRKERGQFAAHAWVEVRGVVVSDGPSVRHRYQAMQ